MQIETLALRIQSGETELLPDLWQEVQRFAVWRARKWFRACRPYNPGLELDDLIQCGFIAMCEAVEKFNPERGAFITLYNYALMSAFSAEIGFRSPQCISLDAPLDDETEVALVDTVPDPNATEMFYAVEVRLYREEIGPVLRAALSNLPAKLLRVLVLRYGEQMTLEQVAQILGVNPSTVHIRERQALRRLRRLPAIQEAHHGKGSP